MWAAPPLRTQFPAMCRFPSGVPTPSTTTTNPAAIRLPITFPVPFTAKKPAAIRLSTGVSRKFQLYMHLDLVKSQIKHRRGGGAREEQVVEKRGEYSNEQKCELYSQLTNLNLHTDSNTVTGDIVKSQRKNRQRAAGGEEQVVEKQENKLSGLDVLRALEKANAKKMKKKRMGKDRKVSGQGRKGTPGDEGLQDYGNKNMRALSIKEDWGNHLDELERRLEELVDKYVA
ncbi:hypothetical protein FXO38_13215 [Capsicum annuum]|nr:uncharacterized protein LOC124892588 [Capsicum annuum]KAF3658423.1 hypothetical protein FXO38_13215 [Capsicum annuum]KAF3659182.1 hypothetical protein FXO37_14066 [Capsicum annuum]